MAERNTENTEIFGQVSKDGRSFIDLENEANARLILKKMDAYRKIKVGKKSAKKRRENVPQTA